MQTIRIKKTELIAILIKNRDEHRDIFLAAQAKYREEVIQQLDAMLKDAREGRRISTTVRLTEPSDHTDDYNRVLRMLELSVDDVFELDEAEFRSYVMDEWIWTRQWALSNSGYVASAKFSKHLE